MGADQRELGIAIGFGDDARHDVLELRHRSERTLRERGLGDPGGVLVEAVEQLGGFGDGRRIELFQGNCHIRTPRRKTPSTMHEVRASSGEHRGTGFAGPLVLPP